MLSNIELIQIYRSKDLETLLHCASDLFAQAGFPYLSLKWTPAPGTVGSMLKNSSTVWDNFSERLGAQGQSLSQALEQTLSQSLARQKHDTVACQYWKLSQRDVFAMVCDAPQTYSLVTAERHVIADFSQAIWLEFVAYPLSVERDRSLVLIAKTQERLTEPMRRAVEQLFSVVHNAYRCLACAQPVLPSGAGDIVLSRRELECLQWLAAGKTLSEAACILGISERTLRFHVNNARERLGVATTMQTVVAAALTYGFDPSDTRRSIYSASRQTRYSAA
ncbi:MAG: helix-turn-helix transcriptional regulator [Pseudomonadota bacterium]